MTESEVLELTKSLKIGKRLPSAVYLHRSLIAELPEELGALVSRIATALKLSDSEWNVVKIHQDWPRISYLSYPDFDDSPYPSLTASKIIDLARKKVRDMSFRDDPNPPILHRKELLVPSTYPGREEFELVTREGEEAGLYEDSRRIGFQKNWETLVQSKGYEIVDGRLFRASSVSVDAGVDIQRERTAISRTQLSAPLQLLSRLGYLDSRYSICDYGCGRGDDLEILESLAVDAVGWDPNHRPEGERLPSDIVNLGFVINVIDDREERDYALRAANQLASKVLIVSAMIASDSHIAKFKPFKDGVITSRKTFQKYYDQSELKEYIERTLGMPAIPAASGIFLVFKDEEFEAGYRFARYGRKKRERQRVHRKTKAERLRQLIDDNSELCEDYWNASLVRGRWLAVGEFDNSEKLKEVFGSIRKAQKALLEVFDESLLLASEARREDEIVFGQAMAYFQGRSPFSQLPKDLKTDIRYFYGTYRELQRKSQELLSSLTDTTCIEGACAQLAASIPHYLEKEKSLTVSAAKIGELPLVLRSYIGCAEQLIGAADQYDLVKIHIHTGKVSVMSYEGFADKPLPALVERIKVDLWNQRVSYYDYVDDFSPKPLFWKSKLMDPRGGEHKKQQSFDKKLDELGIAPDNPHLGFSFETIKEVLAAKRIEIRGHRFYRITASNEDAR